MAINDIITIKGEGALVIAECQLAAGRAVAETVKMVKLVTSGFYVVIRNDFIQRTDALESATADVDEAHRMFAEAVLSFKL